MGHHSPSHKSHTPRQPHGPALLDRPKHNDRVARNEKKEKEVVKRKKKKPHIPMQASRSVEQTLQLDHPNAGQKMNRLKKATKGEEYRPTRSQRKHPITKRNLNPPLNRVGALSSPG